MSGDPKTVGQQLRFEEMADAIASTQSNFGTQDGAKPAPQGGCPKRGDSFSGIIIFWLCLE